MKVLGLVKCIKVMFVDDCRGGGGAIHWGIKTSSLRQSCYNQ